MLQIFSAVSAWSGEAWWRDCAGEAAGVCRRWL